MHPQHKCESTERNLQVHELASKNKYQINECKEKCKIKNCGWDLYCNCQFLCYKRVLTKYSIHLVFEYYEHLRFFKTGSMHTIVPPNYILLGLHGHLNYQINRYLNQTRATLYK